MAIRFVWRVADMLVPVTPGLAVTACSRCRQPVYIDTSQPAGRVFRHAELVCVPCALADVDLRPEIQQMYRLVRDAMRAGTS
jgi:hypothetical protein